MSKHNSNSICLNQVFEDVVNFATNALTTSDNTTYTIGYSDFTYYPRKLWEYTDDIWNRFDTYTFKCTSDFIPSYPVSNYSIKKDGTSIIEVAITGFEEDEISIEKVESKIIVKGKKKEKQKEDRKYLYKNIACRDFELEFQCSDSWDYSKIEAEIDKGILSIKVPVKEDCRPMEIKIKRK